MTASDWMRAIACGAVCLPIVARAAPNEIKVFSDELAGYGEHNVETHVNKASRAGRRAQNTAVPLQVMPEYSYGIWKNWEFSLQLPLASQDERIRSNGYRAELQYVAPHDDDQGFYWGFNFEAARSMRNGERQFWNVEFVPILGWRLGRWHLIANPALTLPLTGTDRKINFEPSAKVAYQVAGKNWLGVEYYVEAGPVQRVLPSSQRSQVLYLAWDGKIGKSDINVGIGRGFTEVSDRWVLKTIFEFSF